MGFPHICACSARLWTTIRAPAPGASCDYLESASAIRLDLVYSQRGDALSESWQ